MVRAAQELPEALARSGPPAWPSPDGLSRRGGRQWDLPRGIHEDVAELQNRSGCTLVLSRRRSNDRMQGFRVLLLRGGKQDCSDTGEAKAWPVAAAERVVARWDARSVG